MKSLRKFFFILIFFGIGLERQDVFAQDISAKQSLNADAQISLKERASDVQETQNSLTMLEKTLHEKSEKLLKYRGEAGQLLSALLAFSRPSIQKILIFSEPSKYAHLSILLKNLTEKTEEAIFDLRQEIAEINYLMSLRQKQLLKLNAAKRNLEIQKKQVSARQGESKQISLPPVSKQPQILKLPTKNSKKNPSKRF